MEIHQLSLLDVSDRIRRRELSAEEVVRALLARIEHHDRRLNSVILLMAETALDQARQADAEIAAGFWRGPLHGVPIGVKDLLWTEGLPTTGGMEILADFRPAEDATVVARLKRAGAVLIAKLHMTEGATLVHHPSMKRPVNPWSAAHWTGVSSSGSGVAPAAGFCFGSIGSDTGGSIRMPSAANNLTGIKPTWGRVSRHGVIHLSEALDHIGPMARSAADAAAILQAIAGADPKDVTTLPNSVPDYIASMRSGVDGLVLGIDWDFVSGGGVPAEITATLKAAAKVLEDLGMRVREIDFPTGEDYYGAGRAIFGAEVAAAHAEHFPQKADRYGPWLRALLQSAQNISPVDIARGLFERERLRGRLRRLFQEVDLILAPGLGRLLPTWATMEAMGRGEVPFDADIMRFTSPFNVGGVPTISFPGGFTEDGLPIGLQLAGSWLAEPMLIRAGVAFQQATSFHTRRPPLD